MVDSWNWLLDVLLPPLINAAIDTEKRNVESQQSGIGQNEDSCGINSHIDQRCRLFSELREDNSPSIELLRSLIPKSCKKVRDTSPVCPKIKKRRREPEVELPKVEVRIDTTVRRIHVNDDDDFPVEIEAVLTPSLFENDFPNGTEKNSNGTDGGESLKRSENESE